MNHSHPRHLQQENLSSFVNEPLTDFSRSANRESLRQELNDLRNRPAEAFPLWINDESVSTEERLTSHDPADFGTVLGYVAKGTVAHADAAVSAAKAAFPSWRRTHESRRAQVLFEIAAALRSRRRPLTALIVRETGKQWREADADVAEAIDFCEFYARNMLMLSTARTRNLATHSQWRLVSFRRARVLHGIVRTVRPPIRQTTLIPPKWSPNVPYITPGLGTRSQAHSVPASC